MAASSSTQPAQVPPPVFLHSINLDVFSAPATQSLLTSILLPPNTLLPYGTSADNQSIMVLIGNSAIQLHSTGNRDARRGQGVKISLVVQKDLEGVKQALREKGFMSKEGVTGREGLDWVEFRDGDGYSWAVAGMPPGC